MDSWSFLSDHGRVLLFLTHDPDMHPLDLAERLSITERSAYGILDDLAAAGYISEHKGGCRGGAQSVAQEQLPEPISREKTFREVLALFMGADDGPLPGRGGRR